MRPDVDEPDEGIVESADDAPCFEAVFDEVVGVGIDVERQTLGFQDREGCLHVL